MAIPAQKKAKIIKPRDDALELHAIHEEDRERNFGLPNLVEKRILKILCPVIYHFISVSSYCFFIRIFR